MRSPDPAEPGGSALGVRRHVFGIPVELPPDVGAPDLPPAGLAAKSQPVTRVRIADDREVDAMWPGAAAQTTRQMRHGDDVVMQVEHAGSAGYLLSIPQWGRFLISADGLEIACDPEADEWAWALAAQALPLAATLRGLEPFHASGVVIDAAALMISAAPGLGKTSLAAHLVGRGAALLTDDVLVIEPADAELRAHPGSRWLHVRAAEAPRLAGYDRLQRVDGRDDRVGFAAVEAQGSAPLKAIYLLARAGDDAEDIERLDPVPPTALLGATYNLSVHEPARLVRQLALCKRLEAEVPAFLVRVRPATSAPTLADRVRAHFTML